MSGMSLTDEQYQRFRKQLSLPGMSAEAQDRLIAGHVVILGIDNWGSLTAQYLADAGVGHLTLVDEDEQALKSAAANLQNSAPNNPQLKIDSKHWSFATAEAEKLASGANVVVDALSNWQHKLAVSDLCMLLKLPLVHAGGSGFRYQVYTMLPGRSACLRCAFQEVGMDDVPLTSTDTSSLLAIAAMIGALEAVETIKLIGKIGASQGNEMWKFDWLSGEFETVRGLNPRRDCPDCGRHLK